MDAREKFGEHERSVRVTLLEAILKASCALSKLPKCIHNSTDIRTAKSMNQFFYNMVKTYWALKPACFSCV